MDYHPDWKSKFLPHPRPVLVHLPPGYDPAHRYSVFYLHDGQNLFDPATAFGGVAWGCDRIADHLVRERRIRPVILVGIGNTPDRLKEYGPKWSRVGSRDQAKRYGRFLVEELKPFIDNEYRTLGGPADTAVGGSSMGGLISLHLCRWHPGVFGNCAAMSPSLWWDREHFLRTVTQRAKWVKTCRFWLDFGSREGATEAGMHAGMQRVRDLADALRSLGREDGRDLAHKEVPDGQHDEASWGRRFDEVLLFLFGTSG